MSVVAELSLIILSVFMVFAPNNLASCLFFIPFVIIASSQLPLLIALLMASLYIGAIAALFLFVLMLGYDENKIKYNLNKILLFTSFGAILSYFFSISFNLKLNDLIFDPAKLLIIIYKRDILYGVGLLIMLATIAVSHILRSSKLHYESHIQQYKNN